MSKSKKRHLVLQLPECSEDGCAPSVFVSTASFSAWLLGRPLTEDFSDKTWIMHDDVWSFLEKPVSEQQWKCHRITRTQFLMFLELLCPYRVAGRLDTATDFLWSKTKEMSPATCSQLERRSPGSKLNWSFAFGAVFTAAQETNRDCIGSTWKSRHQIQWAPASSWAEFGSRFGGEKENSCHSLLTFTVTYPDNPRQLYKPKPYDTSCSWKSPLDPAAL